MHVPDRERLRKLVNYNSFFYSVQRQRSGRSAEEVVGLVHELLEPASVVDVGCGIGAWLSQWRKQGVTDVLGIDGDWVDRGLLQIPAEQFVAHDLSESLDTARSYDLVMSLEVAEHLDKQHADGFLDLLTSLGSVILFSAAIPQQGGQHHVNERWQGDWARDFAARGFIAVDCIRPRIWDNQNVQVWYRQNIILYVRESDLDRHARLRKEIEAFRNRPISMVHPDLYSTMFLRWASAWVRQYRGIRPGTVLRAMVDR
jgi:SAM-dependent methyltransferase